MDRVAWGHLARRADGVVNGRSRARGTKHPHAARMSGAREARSAVPPLVGIGAGRLRVARAQEVQEQQDPHHASYSCYNVHGSCIKTALLFTQYDVSLKLTVLRKAAARQVQWCKTNLTARVALRATLFRASPHSGCVNTKLNYYIDSLIQNMATSEFSRLYHHLLGSHFQESSNGRYLHHHLLGSHFQGLP